MTMIASIPLSVSHAMVSLVALLVAATLPSSQAFRIQPHSPIGVAPTAQHSTSGRAAAAAPPATRRPPLAPLRMSSWDGFGYDDDDDLLDSSVDGDFVAADENDDPRIKAAAGAALEPPAVDWAGPPIDVPQGAWARRSALVDFARVFARRSACCRGCVRLIRSCRVFPLCLQDRNCN